MCSVWMASRPWRIYSGRPPIWPTYPSLDHGDVAPAQDVAALDYRLMICDRTMWSIDKPLREVLAESQRTARVDPERYGTRWDM
jgi:hypothetical protein